MNADECNLSVCERDAWKLINEIKCDLFVKLHIYFY
jgi:hypothetical protein